MANSHELLLRYWEESGREKPLFIRECDERTWRVDEHGMLWTRRNTHDRWTALSVFAGRRYHEGVMILNGDGLDNAYLQDTQARHRAMARDRFGAAKAPAIPYMALTGARINPTTIRTIEVTEDTDTRFNRPLRGVGRQDSHFLGVVNNLRTVDGATLQREDRNTTVWRIPYNGNDFLVSFTRSSAADSWQVHAVSIWVRPEHGAFEWQGCQWGREVMVVRENGTADYATGWFWVERVHSLGATVFSAVRHNEQVRRRYISAFDMNEPEGLYYLAMLPRTGRVRSYEDALALLAPPLVHQAHTEKRNVYRQGDVFAIETNWTDEMVYANAATRVRRHIAMQDAAQVMANGVALLKPLAEEVRTKGTCLSCGCRPMVGNSQAAREALSIHRTGHTASEVVVRADGTTMVRGHMYHDPIIEDPTRQVGDHRITRLGALGGDQLQDSIVPWKESEQAHGVRGGWFLCVRNTVPRMRQDAPPDDVVTATRTQDLEEHRERERQIEEDRSASQAIPV